MTAVVSSAVVSSASDTGRVPGSGPLRHLLLAPRNLCVAILDAYRAVISPLYGDVCRYYPSCSRYTLTAIQQHGVLRGVALGSLRLARCHPWAKGGIDDVPVHARTHAVLGRGGFVLRLEAHHEHCDHSATALDEPFAADPSSAQQPIEGAAPRA